MTDKKTTEEYKRLFDGQDPQNMTEFELRALISNMLTFLTENVVLTGGSIKTSNYPNGGFNLDGDGATTVPVAGVGSIDISTGFAVGSMAAGAVVSINTDSIGAHLAGTIAITGGTGLVAVLMEG